MDLGSIFLILAVALLAALFISRPFTDRKLMRSRLLAAENGRVDRAGYSAESEKQHSSLLAERERLLTALQELDFDYGLGKIPAEDYPEQRQLLLQSGATVLRELDALEAAGDVSTAEDAAARMEAEAARGSLSGAKETDEIERLIAERRVKREGKSAGFCPKCGKPVQASDGFCPRCGKKL